MSTFALTHPRALPRRSSQAIGDDGEEAVQVIHDLPGTRERWHLQRRYPRMQAGQYTDVQGPDFSGWRKRDARHIEVEVKCESEGRLSFDRFQPSQVETLSACTRDGGIALVLVLHGPHLSRAKWCPLPWEEIAPLYEAWAEWTERHPLPADKRERAKVTRDPVYRARASLAENVIVNHAVQPHLYLKGWE